MNDFEIGMNTLKSINDYMGYTITAKHYTYEPWGQYFADGKVDLSKLIFNKDWNDFFQQKEVKMELKEISEALTDLLKNDKAIEIYPYPKLVFNNFNLLSPKNIKVVIKGQDPYADKEIINNHLVPQAMGICFSVPTGLKIPKSLVNIYKNQLEQKEMLFMPTHGNLLSWVNQGVSMPNAALTVEAGYRNSHQKLWANFSKLHTQYLSDHCKNVIFVAWGSDAYKSIKENVDLEKHQLMVCSHPSPLSFSKQMSDGNTKFPAFGDTHFFKDINKYLKKNGKTQIVWQI
jgi:uracil-DNA glycosylase